MNCKWMTQEDVKGMLKGEQTKSCYPIAIPLPSGYYPFALRRVVGYPFATHLSVMNSGFSNQLIMILCAQVQTALDMFRAVCACTTQILKQPPIS